MICLKDREKGDGAPMADCIENAGIDIPAERLNKVVAYLEENGTAKILSLIHI